MYFYTYKEQTWRQNKALSRQFLFTYAPQEKIKLNACDLFEINDVGYRFKQNLNLSKDKSSIKYRVLHL